MNMMKIKVVAPAKINLMLDVTGKRDDGYHNLATIMQSISLSDIVSISETDSGLITVESDNLAIPINEDNIVYKAIEEFIKVSAIHHTGLNVHIKKNIPSEAGLGGGSADAAAALVGMNHLFKADLSVEQLCNIGVKIGADVPFCIIGGTKLCTGVGEILSDVTPLEQCYIVVAKGHSGISTRTAFEKIDAFGFNIKPECNKYNGSVQSVKKYGYNRFEIVTENSDVSYIKTKMLSMMAEHADMSGSGSAVFGLFYDEDDAVKCNDFFTNSGFFSAVCYPVRTGAEIIYDKK